MATQSCLATRLTSLVINESNVSFFLACPVQWRKSGCLYKEERMISTEKALTYSQLPQQHNYTQMGSSSRKWSFLRELLHRLGNDPSSTFQPLTGSSTSKSMHILISHSPRLMLNAYLFFCFCSTWFCFLKATPAAHGSSQTWGSKQSCRHQPTPQPQRHQIRAEPLL